FVPLPDFRDLQPAIKAVCVEHGILGSILLAAEGINGTICGPPSAVEAVLTWLRADPRLADLTHQPTEADYPPFQHLKVRLKAEIVTLRTPADPLAQVGEYVDPADWNAVISDPEVLVIDTRNHHEIALGTFTGAVDPGTRSFSDFPAFVEDLDPAQPVAMFCTGGIRCEKATSYLLSRGFTRVMHLKGGILSYLREVPREASMWQGECFVFDQRRALNHDLAPRYADQPTALEHIGDGWAGSEDVVGGVSERG
ncbi:MAG: UPF0176 protein, partial [Myxococcota bacterium]